MPSTQFCTRITFKPRALFDVLDDLTRIADLWSDTFGPPTKAEYVGMNGAGAQGEGDRRAIHGALRNRITRPPSPRAVRPPCCPRFVARGPWVCLPGLRRLDSVATTCQFGRRAPR